MYRAKALHCIASLKVTCPQSRALHKVQSMWSSSLPQTYKVLELNDMSNEFDNIVIWVSKQAERSGKPSLPKTDVFYTSYKGGGGVVGVVKPIYKNLSCQIV